MTTSREREQASSRANGTSVVRERQSHIVDRSPPANWWLLTAFGFVIAETGTDVRPARAHRAAFRFFRSLVATTIVPSRRKPSRR
jgi:hypothetical protein